VPDPLILIPPSEGKASGGDGAPWTPGTMSVDLDAERERVARALRGAMRADVAARGKLLGVRGDALAAATAANRAVATSPTRPAIERYTGVLYDALGHDTLPAPAQRRLARSVLIVSGLWGLVSPSDPIPDYKLKMGASLGRLGRLSTRWRPSVSAALVERTAGRTVWNLLPQEHDAALELPGVRQVSVTFLEPNRDGELVAVAHWNKALKGALVRHLVEHPTDDPDDLADWEHPGGYRLVRSRTAVDGDRTRLAFVQGP
jgi:cytoplasmic iron level regulating protein YaaA (DUF328/UPF0246 family)